MKSIGFLRWIVPASRDKGAAVDRSDSASKYPKFGDKWNARILPDDDYDDEYEGRREPEDPAKILMAREKFLGRIALISLGVSFFFHFSAFKPGSLFLSESLLPVSPIFPLQDPDQTSHNDTYQPSVTCRQSCSASGYQARAL